MSPPNNMWHPPRDKNAFVGAVASSTRCQDTWEESHPTMLQVTSTWTTVPAVNGLQPLSAVGKNHLKKLPTDERTLVEVQFSSVEIQHTNGEGKKKKKSVSLNTLERVRGTVWLYSYHPSLQMAKLRAERSWPWFFPWWKVRASECPASPAVWNAAQKAHFSLTPSRVIDH